MIATIFLSFYWQVLHLYFTFIPKQTKWKSWFLKKLRYFSILFKGSHKKVRDYKMYWIFAKIFTRLRLTLQSYLWVYSCKTLWLLSVDKINSRSALYKREERYHPKLSFNKKRFAEILNKKQNYRLMSRVWTTTIKNGWKDSTLKTLIFI